jgi:hypothetical protein
MAAELTTEQQLAYMSHIDADLLKTAMSVDTLPKGLLGIYRIDQTDWEGDEVSLLYIVVEDDIDLNKSNKIPEFDIMKVSQYFYDTVLDRFPILNLCNVKNLKYLNRAF